MAKAPRAGDELLAYVARIPADLPLSSWSLRMPFIVDGLRYMAIELMERRAADAWWCPDAQVVSVSLGDIDDFDVVTKEVPPALLAHLVAATTKGSP